MKSNQCGPGTPEFKAGDRVILNYSNPEYREKLNGRRGNVLRVFPYSDSNMVRVEVKWEGGHGISTELPHNLLQDRLSTIVHLAEEAALAARLRNKAKEALKSAEENFCKHLDALNKAVGEGRA